MQIERIYKVNVKENVMRTLVFTNRNIIIALSISFTGITFLLMRNIDIVWRITIAFGLIVISLVMLGAKIDRQPVYEVVARMIPYFFRKKRERF
ncbi:hypothetical protein JW887_04880 [Candidatus Dojkabacteria bacterium]|nr:hypothetical protein [Candidatus Dojkabacteria bacterium]